MEKAIAYIEGNSSNPKLHGQICFCKTLNDGVIITAEIFGLPDKDTSSHFYGMHIHQFGNCDNNFANTGTHFTLDNTRHPMHAGDLPPLLSNEGYSWISFFDKRFSLEDILGKSIVIHSIRDDFTSQPAGDSGVKIGCGVIEAAI